MSDPLIELPPDLEGFAAAIDTQDDELPFTWAAIRDTVYGALRANALALEALEVAQTAVGAKRRAALDAAVEHIDDAVNFGYGFAFGEFQDVTERRGIDPGDEWYDGFVNQRMDHAADDEDDDEEEATE